MRKESSRIMSPWKVVGLLILVLLPIFGKTNASPLGSEHYSVEEQDPAEQTANTDDKDYNGDKAIYEWQLAVWPDDEHHQHQQHEQVVSHHLMADEAGAPIFEEQEIAYPVLTQQQYDDETDTGVDSVAVGQVPTWHQNKPTNAPATQHIQYWQQQQTTETPVHVVAASSRPHTEHHAHHDVQQQEPVVVHVPVWQPVIPAHQPAPAPVPAPPQQQQPTIANEKPVPIFPDIHFDEAEVIADQEDNADVANDHFLIPGVQQTPSKPKPTKRPNPHVEVIEQYHHVNPNGTTEYKLVLSNGMTNYKKIYNKLLPSGKIVTVQEGYDSVPIPGDDPYSNDYQTQFYIADEYGHNVYRVEKHTRRPKLPTHLDYKEQIGLF